MKSLFLCMMGLALACTGPLKAQQDERAERYLQAVSEQFDMETPYQIKLDYVRKDLMQNTSAEGEGMIWMKGFKYKIKVNEYIVYFNGEKLYSQNTDLQEVYVSTPDPHEPGYLQAVPIQIIKSYQKDFKYQYMGTTSFMGKNRIEIQLYPKDINGPYSMLKMFIQPKSLKLEAIQLKHKEGIVYDMLFSEKRENREINDQSFEFDLSAWPDTEVIELLE